MNKKTVILFDIDYTLFSSLTYRKSLWEELGRIFAPSHLERFAVSAEEAYLSLRKTILFFETKLFTETLEKRTGIRIDATIVDRKTKEMAGNGQFIYEEVIPLLEKLTTKKNIVTGIFSTGLTDLQTAKIASVRHLLTTEHIHILKDKKSNLPEILEKYRDFRLFLVDDYWQVLDEAKKMNPDIHTVWMKRGRHAESLEKPEGFEPNAVITNLNGLLPLIDNDDIV